MRVQCNVIDFYEIDFELPTNSSEEADIYHFVISSAENGPFPVAFWIIIKM